MTDFDEEQRSEIEALESIYPEEFSVLQTEPKYSFTISVKTVDYEEGSDEGAYCVLNFTYVDNYPDHPPIIDVTDACNIEDIYVQELQDFLIEQAKENVGMVMVFTLVSSAQEWLGAKTEELAKNRLEEAERKIKETEEAERKKFEGTRVTVESFLTWKAAFDAEMAALKSQQLKDDIGSKKLTGRELFETDHTLNESDIQFLQDGEEEVKVDESLFQDLDDLDLDVPEDDDS